jgi:hypothetical protein
MKKGIGTSFGSISEANRHRQCYGKYLKLSYDDFMTHDDKLPYILIDCQVYEDVDTEGILWWMNDFDKM